LAIAPDSEKIRFYLAAVYEEVKAYRDAIEQFETVKPDSTLYPEAVVHTAYLYKLSGKLERAAEVMSESLAKRSDVPQFYSFYASLLDDQNKTAESVKVLNSAVKKFPKDDQLYFYLGSMQDKAGSKEACIKSMKTVVELNPNHVQALNYLGYTLADLNRDLAEAEKFVRRALVLKPDDGYITDSLGWIKFKQGEFQEAISILEKANKMKPDESIIAEHLGDAYLRFSLRDKARQMYLRAVNLENDESTVQKIKRKLIDLDDQERRPASY
jgi:tetratricopeptide (TPR) repeat protein